MSDWTLPDKQDIGASVMGIGTAAVLYGLGRFNYPDMIVPGLLAAGGAAALVYGVETFREGRAANQETDGLEEDFSPASYPQVFYLGKELHPTIENLLKLIDGALKGEYRLVQDSIELDDEKNVVNFDIEALTTGGLSSATKQTQLINAVRTKLDGLWKANPKLADDRINFSLKSAIPKMIFPPIWDISKTPQEASVRYKKWMLNIGMGEEGPVLINLQAFPHIAAIATSGGGKSIALKAWMESVRALGGELIIGDGKGSDYSSYKNLPGVRFWGNGRAEKTGMQYVAAIDMAYKALQERMSTASARRDADPDNWRDVPPIVLVLDEMKAMIQLWKGLPKDEQKIIESNVNQILALGREHRVHVWTASQDLRAESIPPSWLTNIGMKVSLGKPDGMTVTKGFDPTIERQVREIAATINPAIKGRGMIGGVTEAGKAQVVEYQGYFSYSPGEGMPGFPEADSEFAKFKSEVSDNIPRMYSRQAYIITSPSAGQLESEKKKGNPLGYIDFGQFLPSELAELDLVNLDMRDSSGNIVPNPDMYKYDPTHPDWICAPVNTKKSVSSAI